MNYLALAIGLLAVFFYMLGYLQKKKKNILLLNLTSRLLYILQYLLLGAFSGAVLDVAGAISTVVAGRKNTPFIKKHLWIVIAAVNVLILGSGIYVQILTKDPLGVLPIVGVLCHINAFWFEKERNVRRLSILGSPFWLAYNFLSGAYGSCVGDILSMVSLGISMYRYDRTPKMKEQE
ncbi:MAG: YgjV family protein [Clostridia bacterium]|nr:YgjV family protein [Clostridia bacterium]